MTWLLMSVQWEILATAGIVLLVLAVKLAWLGLSALWRAVQS